MIFELLQTKGYRIQSDFREMWELKTRKNSTHTQTHLKSNKHYKIHQKANKCNSPGSLDFLHGWGRARVGAQSGLGPGPGWGPYGPLWAHMGPYGPIWGPYKPIWALICPYGPMGPYGPCGTLVIPSTVGSGLIGCK